MDSFGLPLAEETAHGPLLEELAEGTTAVSVRRLLVAINFSKYEKRRCAEGL